MSTSETSKTILRSIAVGMANFGAPVLLDEKDWREADRMADTGLLQRHQPLFKSFGYTLTEAGIAAYHEAFPPQPVQAPVKAWGETPPRSMKDRVSFIKSQCTGELESAYWLDVDGQESLTLSKSALEKRLEELGYDRMNRDGTINFGREDSGDAMPTCDVTGALLSATWSNEPSDLAYGLEGFSWRRSQGFQMVERDWLEAKGYIERLDDSEADQKRLIRLIVDSCFLDPHKVNDTGLICPGGGCYDSHEELIDLFGFMGPNGNVERSGSRHRPMSGG